MTGVRSSTQEVARKFKIRNPKYEGGCSADRADSSDFVGKSSFDSLVVCLLLEGTNSRRHSANYITDAADRVDDARLALLFELVPQRIDEDVDHIGSAVEVEIPDLFGD